MEREAGNQFQNLEFKSENWLKSSNSSSNASTLEEANKVADLKQVDVESVKLFTAEQRLRIAQEDKSQMREMISKLQRDLAVEKRSNEEANGNLLIEYFFNL